MSEYKDDPSISDEAELWRRIPPYHIVDDKKRGIKRPSSAAFTDSRDGSPMSVMIEEIMREFGKGPEDALHGHKDFALATITAGLVRQNKQGVARDPLPEEPAHGVVFGNKNKVRKKLALGSRWIVFPA